MASDASSTPPKSARSVVSRNYTSAVGSVDVALSCGSMSLPCAHTSSTAKKYYVTIIVHLLPLNVRYLAPVVKAASMRQAVIVIHAVEAIVDGLTFSN